MDQSPYIRSMGVGEILDASVRLYRKNFRLLIGAQLPMTLFSLITTAVTVYVVRAAPSNLLNMVTQSYDTPLPDLQYLWIPIVILLFQIVVYPLTVSAVIKVASDSALQNPVTVKGAYRFCVKILVKLVTTHIVLSIAMGIVYGIPYAIASVILSIMIMDSITAVGMMAFLLFISITAVAGGYVWMRWLTTFVVIINEDKFNLGAMGRSWDLMKGYTVKMLVVMVLVYLIPTVIEFSSDILEVILKTSVPALSLVFGAVAVGILFPLVESARVLVYFQLRIKKEGFDLTQKMKQLSPSPG